MDIGRWLLGLGLEQYAAAFRENRIDRTILSALTVEDLKDLGVVSVGDRRRLLDAIALLAIEPAKDAHSGAALAAAELESRQRFLEAVLDSIGDPIFVKDRDHRYLYVNEAKCRLAGCKREDIIGKTDYDLSRPDKGEVKVFVERDDIVLKTGREDTNEEAVTGADGVLRTVVTKKSLYVDDAGQRCVVGIIRDITELRRAEEALQRSQAAYLAEAQRLSATGSFGWNPKSGEIFWSDETYRIFEYEPRSKPSIEMIMKRVHPEDVALVEQVIERARTDRQGFELEHRLEMPDGSVKHLHVVARDFPGDSGEMQFVGAVKEVTAAKNAQERLNAAQTQLGRAMRLSVVGELTASISHEVTQPLAAIGGNSDAAMTWLARDPTNLDEARTALRRIKDDAARAIEIVGRIRALVRKSHVNLVPLEINVAVNDAVSLMRPLIVHRRITLDLDLAPGLPAVLGDCVQLQQVVINLIGNAVQAMADIRDRPRMLCIQSKPENGGQVLVSVQDSGVGINPEAASRLFDALYTTKPNGMGLGLSICHTIITAHGGRIWASNNSRPGATFSFSLPLMTGGASSPSDSKPREVPITH
ncbi:PAS domain S-box protein [Bradyrhizobium sp. UFLA05-109]